MRKLILLLLIVFLQVASAQTANEQNSMINLIRQKIGFAAEIPVAVCNQTFPFHKTISQKFSSNNSSDSFNLFAFTAKAFDPKKPSILFIHGGPGGLWGPREAIESSNQFPEVNVVFFHYRGGGCSAFANNNVELDAQITSAGTIRDIEAIRDAYGVRVWKSVVGFSYGTDIARRYAHYFPNRIQSLILEGLNSSVELSSEDEVARVLKTISDRYTVSQNLQSSISSNDFKNFIVTLQSYFSQFSPSQNFGMAALWEFYQKNYTDYYSAAGSQVPKYLERSTFLAVTLLMYEGENASSDTAISILMSNFGFGNISMSEKTLMTNELQPLDKFMFPFLFPNYIDVLNNSGLLSWRVQLTMPENDKVENDNSICSTVPTIVINGTQDLATPVENVQKFLSNKSCASGANTALLIQGGGHSSLLSMRCLNEYVRHFIGKQDTSEDLKLCDLPVNLQKY